MSVTTTPGTTTPGSTPDTSSAASTDTATCPDCQEAVAVPAGARVTSIVLCTGCDAELEVVGLNPTELALAPEIEEDFGE